MADLGSSISLNASKFAAGVAQTRAKLTELNTAFVENRNKMKELNAEAKKLEQQEKELAKEMKDGGTAEQREQLQQLRDKMAQVNAEIGTLKTRESELKHDISQTNRELQEQRSNASNLSDAFSQLGQLFGSLGIAEACHQIANAFGECVKAAEDFEATMSTVEALSGATASEMDQLSAKAKQLGATTKFTATESAQAMTFMGMAGWDATQMLGGMDGVMNLAAASGSDLATTSDIITDALTAFGLAAEDTAHFADVLAATATNSNTSVEIMGETFKNCASVAGALGYSIEDVSTAVGLMANSGVKGTIAGTALKNTFNGLLQGATLTSKAFGEVEISAINADGTMKDFGETVDELRKYFSQMSEAERVMNAMDIAGKYGYNGLLAIVNSAQQDFDKLTDSINECEGAASKMAEVKMDNLSGQVTLMNSALDALKNTLGSSYDEELKELAKAATDVLTKINEFLSKHPSVTKAIVGITAAVTGLVGAFATFATVATAVEMVKKFTATTKLATTAQAAFNAVSKANPYILLATAIAGVIVVLNDYAEAASNAAEKATEWSDQLENIANNTKTAIDEQSRLKDVVDEYKRINESVTDASEKKEALAELQKTLNDLYGDEKTGIDLVNGKYEEQLGLLEQISEKEKAHLLNELEKSNQEAQKLISSLENQFTNIEFKYDVNSRADDEFAKALNEILSEQNSLVNTITGDKQQQIEMFGENGIINFSSTGDITTQIDTLEKLEDAILATGEANGRFADTFEQIGERLKVLKEAKTRGDEIKEAYDKATNSITSTNEAGAMATDTFNLLANAFEAATPEELSKKTDELTKSASSLISEYSSLYETLDKLKKGEALNYEQMQALIEVYPDLAKYVQVTADGYSVEIDALDDLNNALDDNLQKRIEHEKQATYETLRGWEERKKIIEREIATSAQAAAHDPMARAAYDAAMSNLKAANSEIADLYAKLDTWETTPAYMASGRGKSSKTSSSSSGSSKSTSKEKDPAGLKTLLSNAKTTSAAFKEMHENEELALSTVQALIDAGYDEKVVYQDASGKWIINAEEYLKAANAQIDAAKNVEGTTEIQKNALEALRGELSKVTEGLYETAKAEKELKAETVSAGETASSMKTLSAAIVEQKTDKGLSADTVSKLSGTRYAEALTVGVDAQITLDTAKLRTILSDEIEDAIKQLETELATATDESKIKGLEAQIQAFRNLKAVIGEVTEGLYGVEQAEEKLVSDAALKATEDAANRRLKQIDAELKAKQKLRDETLKAIDDEVQARKRLTEDNDIQRQIDQAMAQLKYSQLDDFSQAQLQRKIQSLQNDKADMLWERGIEDRRAAANEEYDTAAEQLNAEKEAINNSLEVLRTLNDTVASGITNLEETIKAAMEAVKPDSTFNLTINNADKMTVDQLMALIENQYGSTGAV